MSEVNLDLAKEAIRHFKDWSNYLLVTTVAILAWVAKTETELPYVARFFCLISFALSIMFANFTLALVPLVTEKIDRFSGEIKAGKSIFEIPVCFHIAWMWDFLDYPAISDNWTLKWVCWPQHILFLVGIAAFTVGSLLPRCS